MSYQSIARLIPTIQAAALVNENAKTLKSKKKNKNIVGLGVKNIVGTELIKLEAGLVAGL